MSPGRSRVLVIDDDPLIVRLVRTHLDRAGFQVSDAPDGPTGLDIAARESPDFVILDLMLPGAHGAR
jgi:DNA-binding response OmpR family regulator